MLFEILILFAVLANAVSLAALSRAVRNLAGRLDTAEAALESVKQAAEDYPRIKNEVNDMRDTLEELPLDDLVAQAQFEKAYADGLESISTYSVEVAMRGGGDNS